MNLFIVCFVSLFLSVNAFATGYEVRAYSGYFEVDKDGGNFYGTILKNSSEDETLSVELGFKQVVLKDMDYLQNETYISFEREVSYDSDIKFSYLNIDEDTYGGNLYDLVFRYGMDNGVELSTAVGFLDYKLHDVYQWNASVKSFFGETPFYYDLKYNFNAVGDDDKTRYYNALDIGVGFMYAKYQGVISSFIGEKRYAMQDEDCFSWNVGNLHKRGLRASFIYQATINALFKVDYLYSKMYRIDHKISNLSVMNFVMLYKF
jgi:hypothetical protein